MTDRDQDDTRVLRTAADLGGVSASQRDALPRFLIIAPPKTGTSWLAANLARHPDLSLPPEKETRFFSSSWKWCDVDWYVSRFPAGATLLRGESSPTYAILPSCTIRLLRELVPDLKLIFLMRDPVARAWSQAKHTWRYRVRDFTGCTVPLADAGDELWRATFVHDWTATSGDYLGQLRRWLAVFPRDQVFVGHFEQIVGDPETLMADVCRFLGVSTVDQETSRLRDPINAGVDGDLPATHREYLQRLLQPSATELLQQRETWLGVPVMPDWPLTMTPAVSSGDVGRVMARIRRLECDDDFLARTVAGEETFPGARPLHVAVAGFRMFLARRQVIALAEHIDVSVLSDVDDATIDAWQGDDACFRARSLDAAIALVLAARDSRVSQAG